MTEATVVSWRNRPGRWSLARAATRQVKAAMDDRPVRSALAWFRAGSQPARTAVQRLLALTATPPDKLASRPANRAR